MKKKSTTYYIVLYAIYAALVFVARILDQLISFAALPINFAVITLSVAFTIAFIEPSLKNGFIAGTIFGLSSFITSFIFGKTAILGFANPCISVFPRMIVGIALFVSFRLVYLLLKKLFPKFGNAMYLSIPFACAVGALVNTVTVLSMMWVFKVAMGMEALYVVFVANAIPELIIPAIVVPPVVLGVRKGLRINDKYTPATLTAEIVPTDIIVEDGIKEVNAEEDIVTAEVVNSEIVHVENLAIEQKTEEEV